MRIVSEVAAIQRVTLVHNGGSIGKSESEYINIGDTFEITDSQLCEIERGWHREAYELGTYDYPFAQYFNELIKLRIRASAKCIIKT